MQLIWLVILTTVTVVISKLISGDGDNVEDVLMNCCCNYVMFVYVVRGVISTNSADHHLVTS